MSGIIESVHIARFRKFNDVTIKCGQKLTVITGQNGTQKTTLLGLLAHPFSMTVDTKKKDIDPLFEFKSTKTLFGKKFESKFSDKFKLDETHESVKGHEYTLYFSSPNIGDNGSFTLESMQRDKKNNKLRLWKKGSRSSGDGYITLPVIYLSLKRVTPIGEEGRIKSLSLALEDDDTRLLVKEYNDILFSANTNIENDKTNQLDSSNKKQLIVHPNTYGPLTISAGQDNIGSILTAILSFKNLKEQFPNEYKGGLLFIDEIESTLFPAAQTKLIERLFSYARDYNIQIFCTTHSASIIKIALDERYKNDVVVNYLKSIDNNIKIENNLTYEQAIAHLSLTVIKNEQNIKPKIRVYSEDNEARLFLKALLPAKYYKLLNIINVNLGANELIRLKDCKIQEFSNNMILLDGDKQNASKNILCLPGPFGPDRILYNFLKDLPESDEFWSDNISTGGYSKQICFKDYGQPPINPHGGQLREFYKNWFQNQLKNKYWGKSDCDALKKWKKDNHKAYESFEKHFVKVYNYLATKNKLPQIE